MGLHDMFGVLSMFPEKHLLDSRKMVHRQDEEWRRDKLDFACGMGLSRVVSFQMSRWEGSISCTSVATSRRLVPTLWW